MLPPIAVAGLMFPSASISSRYSLFSNSAVIVFPTVFWRLLQGRVGHRPVTPCVFRRFGAFAKTVVFFFWLLGFHAFCVFWLLFLHLSRATKKMSSDGFWRFPPFFSRAYLTRSTLRICPTPFFCWSTSAPFFLGRPVLLRGWRLFEIPHWQVGVFRRSPLRAWAWNRPRRMISLRRPPRGTLRRTWNFVSLLQNSGQVARGLLRRMRPQCASACRASRVSWLLYLYRRFARRWRKLPRASIHSAEVAFIRLLIWLEW